MSHYLYQNRRIVRSNKIEQHNALVTRHNKYRSYEIHYRHSKKPRGQNRDNIPNRGIENLLEQLNGLGDATLLV